MDKITDSGSLLPHTRELLRNRPQWLSLPKIAKDTGLTLGWLNTFSRSAQNSPNVIYVERLYEYLSGKKLLANVD